MQIKYNKSFSNMIIFWGKRIFKLTSIEFFALTYIKILLSQYQKMHYNIPLPNILI
jgi:hypothetical protein